LDAGGRHRSRRVPFAKLDRQWFEEVVERFRRLGVDVLHQGDAFGRERDDFVAAIVRIPRRASRSRCTSRSTR
jgi:hypothetical protein